MSTSRAMDLFRFPPAASIVRQARHAWLSIQDGSHIDCSAGEGPAVSRYAGSRILGKI